MTRPRARCDGGGACASFGDLHARAGPGVTRPDPSAGSRRRAERGCQVSELRDARQARLGTRGSGLAGAIKPLRMERVLLTPGAELAEHPLTMTAQSRASPMPTPISAGRLRGAAPPAERRAPAEARDAPPAAHLPPRRRDGARPGTLPGLAGRRPRRRRRHAEGRLPRRAGARAMAPASTPPRTSTRTSPCSPSRRCSSRPGSTVAVTGGVRSPLLTIVGRYVAPPWRRWATVARRASCSPRPPSRRA